MDGHQAFGIAIVVHPLREEIRFAFFWRQDDCQVFLEMRYGLG